MKEVWKGVDGYRGLYQVSNQGNVKSLDRVITTGSGIRRTYKSKKIKGGMNTQGYKQFSARSNGSNKMLLIHRVVAKAFVDGYAEGLVVDHIDMNRQNNNQSNLRWCTQSLNLKYARDNRDVKRGSGFTSIQIRVTQEEKDELARKASEAGFSSVGEYLRVTGKKRR